MEMIYVLLSIVQTIGISLGVGCSTVALASFFVAIADGKIDEVERKMLGVVYVLLRVAMVAIIVTTFLLLLLGIYTTSVVVYFNPFTISHIILIVTLFLNAFLMTKHIMPSKFGPAIQASTWYTFGIILALEPLGLTHFTLFEFIVGYLAAIALTIAIVNAIMEHLKKPKSTSPVT